MCYNKDSKGYKFGCYIGRLIYKFEKFIVNLFN